MPRPNCFVCGLAADVVARTPGGFCYALCNTDLLAVQAGGLKVADVAPIVD